jgi:hypothetical protein
VADARVRGSRWSRPAFLVSSMSTSAVTTIMRATWKNHSGRTDFRWQAEFRSR